ncbi:MAG: adenylate kinase [Hadesarchaea archaeon]|nr:MAG: adenylate kinase [Hadesarchaea archaeon]
MVNKVVVVTGVPGVGKSTVIEGALKQLETKGVEYELIIYGDVMLELLKRKGITHRDEMRKFPVGPYREVQREAGKQIARVAKRKPVLVDTHCLVKKPEGYYPGLPRWVLEELKPESIVIIEASPEEVAGRRTKDTARKRDKELLNEVVEHQQLNRATATAYAALTGATVRIIHNRDGKLSEAIKEMVEALR